MRIFYEYFRTINNTDAAREVGMATTANVDSVVACKVGIEELILPKRVSYTITNFTGVKYN